MPSLPVFLLCVEMKFRKPKVIQHFLLFDVVVKQLEHCGCKLSVNLHLIKFQMLIKTFYLVL